MWFKMLAKYCQTSYLLEQGNAKQATNKNKALKSELSGEFWQLNSTVLKVAKIGHPRFKIINKTGY